MKPYKLKHIPTGLYFQPFKHKGSHFSKKGKVYQTKANILNLKYFSDGSTRSVIAIFVHEKTLIYKEFKNILIWVSSHDESLFKTETLASDWVIEEI